MEWFVLFKRLFFVRAVLIFDRIEKVESSFDEQREKVSSAEPGLARQLLLLGVSDGEPTFSTLLQDYLPLSKRLFHVSFLLNGSEQNNLLGLIIYDRFITTVISSQ